MSSGASIAPPEHFRSSAVVITAPAVSTRSTRQRRSDVQAMPKSAPSTSKTATAISEEEEEEEEEEKGSGRESGDDEEEDGEDEGIDEEDEGNNAEDGEDEEDEGNDEESGEDEEGGEDEEDGEDGEDKGGEGEKVSQGKKDAKSSGKDDSGEGSRKQLTPPLSNTTVPFDLADVETHQRGRSMTPKAGPDIDILMQSPQNSPPKLHGASRTSGGIFRGQATGNVLNAADFSNPNNNEYIGPVRGQINIYLSQDDPARLSPDSLIAYARVPYDYAPKTPIAPVLEKVARRYSPVRC